MRPSFPKIPSAAVWMLLLPGCAGAMSLPPATTPRAIAVEVVPEPAAEETAPTQEALDGVMHVVQPGQTLWRIARAYDVSIETLASANGIYDPTRVDVGTPLFIPGARATLDVAPYPAPPPSRRAPAPFDPPVATDFLWPIADGPLMRPFGEQRKTHRHAGVDIRGAKGQPILAVRDGVVAFAGHSAGGYGSMVIVDHGDGVQSLYGHAQKTLVKTGDPVRRGETIALVGRTGNATTEHCHFEIRVENRPVDPMPYFLTTTAARQ